MWTTILIGGALAVLAIKIFHWLQSCATIPALHTRWIFVTGCDSGFGKRLALRLDNMGCHVFAACLTSSGARQLSEATSERVTTLLMDVTKDDDIERAARDVQKALPADTGLWGLVNNAGIFGPYGTTEMLTRKEYLAPLQVNLLGMTQVTRCFLPLVRQGQGRIVNTTSVVGRFALSPAPYVASKFAAVGFTENLRRELYHHRVSVHSIEPGAYNTDLLSDQVARDSVSRVFQATPPHVRQVYGEDFPEKVMKSLVDMKRFVAGNNPEEVVDAYVHALTSKRPSLSYVVGLNGNLFFRPLSYLPTWLADFLLQPALIRPKKLS